MADLREQIQIATTIPPPASSKPLLDGCCTTGSGLRMIVMQSRSAAVPWTIPVVIWPCCHRLIAQQLILAHPTLRRIRAIHSRHGTFPSLMTICLGSGSLSARNTVIGMRMYRTGPATVESRLRVETQAVKACSVVKIAAAAHSCRERHLWQVPSCRPLLVLHAKLELQVGAQTYATMRPASEQQLW